LWQWFSLVCIYIFRDFLILHGYYFCIAERECTVLADDKAQCRGSVPMQCPKCNHPLSDESAHCVYCGEPIRRAAPVFDVSEDMSIEEMVRHTMEGIKDKPEGACKGAGEGSAANPVSLEKTAGMLAKMKDLMENGRFDADVYERMALDTIKDFLFTMDDGAQLIFVSYEIADSKLAPFLTEDIIGKIKQFVMDTIAER
jgi:hypothetical protein